jgi:hypothetical protein
VLWQARTVGVNQEIGVNGDYHIYG